MNFPLFIAKKIYSDQGDKRKVSRPAIRIATIGVAIGLAVMIVTVGVVLGFKHTIRDKVVGFGGHIQIHNVLRFNDTDPYFITADDSLMSVIKKIKGVRHVERYTITQGLLKMRTTSWALPSKVWDQNSIVPSSSRILWRGVFRSSAIPVAIMNCSCRR